jgi:hypothetical protein
MPPSCPHCDQPDVSLLRLVFIGEILRADETLLVTLADLLQTSGLLPLAAAELAATHRRFRRGRGMCSGWSELTTKAGEEAGPHPARPARDLPAREACTNSDKRSWEALRGTQAGSGTPV